MGKWSLISLYNKQLDIGTYHVHDYKLCYIFIKYVIN